jgi:hypothetical protein
MSILSRLPDLFAVPDSLADSRFMPYAANLRKSIADTASPENISQTGTIKWLRNKHLLFLTSYL